MNHTSTHNHAMTPEPVKNSTGVMVSLPYTRDQVVSQALDEPFSRIQAQFEAVAVVGLILGLVVEFAVAIDRV